MEVIFDGKKLDALAVRYSDGEFAAARFAVQLYRDQLEAGRITVDDMTFHQAVDIAECVDDQLSAGLDTISPPVDAVLRNLFLPYLASIHNGLSPDQYQACCDLLQCTPFELFSHGIEATKMLEADRTESSVVNFAPGSH